MNSVVIKAGQSEEASNKAVWTFLKSISSSTRDWTFQRCYGKGVDPLSGFGSIAFASMKSLREGKSVELSFDKSTAPGGLTTLNVYTDEV